MEGAPKPVVTPEQNEQPLPADFDPSEMMKAMNEGEVSLEEPDFSNYEVEDMAEEKPVESFQDLMEEQEDGQYALNFDNLKEVPFAGEQPEEVKEEVIETPVEEPNDVKITTEEVPVEQSDEFVVPVAENAEVDHSQDKVTAAENFEVAKQAVDDLTREVAAAEAALGSVKGRRAKKEAQKALDEARARLETAQEDFEDKRQAVGMSGEELPEGMTQEETAQPESVAEQQPEVEQAPVAEEKPKSLEDLNLNIVSVQEEAKSREKMAEHEAEERFNQERAGAKGLTKIFTYGKAFGGIRKKQLIKEILTEQPDESIQKQNVKLFEKALEQGVDDVLVGGEKLTTVENKSDGRIVMIRNALQELAKESANGNAKDAYKEFKENVENWRKDGVFAEQLDKNGNFSSDNILEKGQKVVEIAKDLDAYNTSIDNLNKYIEKNITLNIGEAKSGLNTEVYYDRATKAAMIAGVAGAAIVWGSNRAIRAVTLGAGGAAVGAITGFDKAKSNINKMNINEALGRSNEVAEISDDAKFGAKLLNKFSRLKKGMAENLGLYEYGESSAEITEKASDVTEALRSVMKYDEEGNIITDKDGNIEWAEGVTDGQKEEFAEYVGKVRAMFEVGSDKNIDLITYDVKNGEGLENVSIQRNGVTMALADAMRMLRVNDLGDKVAESQESYVKALNEQIGKINNERKVYVGAMMARNALIGLAIGGIVSEIKDKIDAVRGVAGDVDIDGASGDTTVEKAATVAGAMKGSETPDIMDAAGEAAQGDGEVTKFVLENSEVKFIRGADGGYDAMIDTDNNGYFEATDLKGINFENGQLTDDAMQKLQDAGYEMTGSKEIDGVETVSAKIEKFADWIKGQNIKTVEAHESGDVVDFHRAGWNTSANNDVVLGGARLSADHQNIIIDVSSKNGNVNVDDLEVALTAQDGSNLAFSYDIENGQIEIPREDAAASLFNLGNDGTSMTYDGRYMEVYGTNESGLAEIYRTTANDDANFEDVRIFEHSNNPVTEYTFTNAETGQSLEMSAPMSSYAPEGTNTGVSEWYLDNSATTNGGEIIMSEKVVGTLGDGTEIHESFNEGGFNVENDGYFAEVKSSDHAMGSYLWGDEGKVTPENIDHIDKSRLAQEFLDDGQGGLEGTTTLSAYTGTDESLANISDVNERIALLHQDSVAYDNYTNEYWNGLKQDLVDGGYKPDVKLAGGDGTIKLTSYGYIGDDGNVKVAWQVKQATEQEGIFQFNREVNGVETEYLQDTGAVNKILIENGYDPNEYEVVQSGFGMRCSGDNPQIDIFIRKRGSIPGSEGTPTKDTPEDTPEKTTPEGTPTKDTPEGTPTKDTPEDTPDKTTPEDTPDKTTPEDTPDKTTPEDTPDKTTPEDTPDKTTPENTPDKTTTELTSKNAEATKNMDDGSGSPDTKAGELEERPEEMSNYNRETQNTPIENNNRNDELIDNADRTLANDTNRTQEQINEQAANAAAAEAAAQAQQAADNAADNMAQQAQDLSNLTDEQAAEMFKNGQI